MVKLPDKIVGIFYTCSPGYTECIAGTFSETEQSGWRVNVVTTSSLRRQYQLPDESDPKEDPPGLAE